MLCCSHHDRVDLAVMQLLGDREGTMHATVSPQSASPTNSLVWLSWPLASPGYQSGVIRCSFVPPQEKSMQQEQVQLAMCFICKTQDLSLITSILKSRAWGREFAMLSQPTGIIAKCNWKLNQKILREFFLAHGKLPVISWFLFVCLFCFPKKSIPNYLRI